jgi:hypothetical protein
MHSAISMPSGIWIASTDSENSSCRYSASCNSLSRITAWNHSVPTNTFCVGLKMSCTE